MLFERLETMPHNVASEIAVSMAFANPRHVMQTLNELLAGQALSVEAYDARLRLIPATILRMERAS